jgi:hypothetical protein
MILKKFTICDQLLQRFGKGSFIRGNLVLFVEIRFYSCLFVVYLWKYFLMRHEDVFIYIYMQ